jgi:hypothetical protein
VRVWEVATGKELPALGTLPIGGGAKSLAISLDGKLVATGGMDGIVRLWDVAGRKGARELRGQQGSIWSLAFSPNGRRLAAVTASNSRMFSAFGEDRTIRVWEVGTGSEVMKLQGPRNGSWCVAWSPDGRLLATGGEDDLARVWEVASGEERLCLRGHQGAVVSLVFTPNGRLVTGSYDTTALVWDLASIAGSSRPRAEEFPRLWETLRGNAGPAFGAIVSLQRGGNDSVAWLEKRLSPAVAPEQRRLEGFIAKLDDDRFAVREQAARELQGLGDLAVPALRRALDNRPSLEVRRRIERLLAQDRVASPDRLRNSRAIEALERVDTPAARRLLEKLAGGAPAARLSIEAKAALARLPRKE